MRLAYLTNEYPAPSHTFIRREIVAVEALVGEPVLRFAVRPSAAPLVTIADQDELCHTRYLLGGLRGKSTGAAVAGPTLAWNVLRTLLGRPLCFARALCKTIELSRGANRGVITHLAYLAQACLLARWTRAAGVAHVHVHFASNPAAIALLCERLGGPTWSLTVHGPEEFDDPTGFRLREKIAASRFVVGISEYTARELRRVARPEDVGKIHVVRCGIDAAFLTAPVTPLPPAPRLVCVGRLCERKRQIVLVRALGRIVARRNLPDPHLTLIGDGPTRVSIEHEITQLGLLDHVDLAGWQDEEQVREALRAAKCFVLPSSAEGLPVAIMEALALGRPVIATAVAGIPELIEHNVSGWLVPVDDVDALAIALEHALTLPPARLADIAEAGRRRVVALHDSRRSAEALIELFKRQPPA